MQRIPKAIAASQLSVVAIPYYSTPEGTTATINNLSLTNTSDSPASVTLHRVVPGGVPDDGNCFMSDFSIAAGKTYVPPQAIGLQLNAGMTLQARASVDASVTLIGGVYETSGG